ncbi:hypothetical protein SAMN00790413_03890 [Deinococcus hopiensis KR-140]|uniref:Uncharacterized protein n=1 Tax=Deinococcus hopiensis KR-140 TaxID=695939 RepID=A0A1W1U9G8_9DEIO|nr:hypothetical protein SAMN00790413_03890 [Deinococcus hopiensis KR-140]
MRPEQSLSEGIPEDFLKSSSMAALKLATTVARAPSTTTQSVVWADQTLRRNNRKPITGL